MSWFKRYWWLLLAAAYIAITVPGGYKWVSLAGVALFTLYPSKKRNTP